MEVEKGLGVLIVLQHFQGDCRRRQNQAISQLTPKSASIGSQGRGNDQALRQGQCSNAQAA